MRSSASPEPAAMHTHALDQIQFIRSTMERAGSFTSVSGRGAMFAGLTALIAAAIASRQDSFGRWIAVWIAAAAIAGVGGVIAMARKARQGNTPLLSPLGRRFLLGFCAPLAAGVVLTVAMFQRHLISDVPAMWLLLYGTAFLTGGAFSVRIVPLMGLCFAALGIATFFLPLHHANLMLAFGFGVLHLAFGAVIARRYGG